MTWTLMVFCVIVQERKRKNMSEENMTDSTDSVKNMRDKIERQEKE